MNSISESPCLPVDGQTSLAQIAASGIAIAWYEAVAIVQQICSVLVDQSGHPVLDPGIIFLQSSGDASIQSSGSSESDVSVRVLGELLRVWLAETPYPMPLRLVVAQATCTPPFYTSIAEFSEALSHYERPGRQELVRDVYDRWHGAEAVSGETPPEADSAVSSTALWQRVQTFYGWLAARALAGGRILRSTGGALLQNVRRLWQRWRAPRIQAVARSTPRMSLPAWWNARVVALAAAVVLLTALAGWLVAAGVGRSAAMTVSAAIGGTDNQMSGALASRFGATLKWLTAPSIRIEPAAAAQTAKPRTIDRTARGGDVPSAPLSDPEIIVQAPEVQPPAASSPVPGVQTPSAVSASVVYSAADPDVTPPVSIDQQLLDQPPTGAPNVTAIEIVVDDTGHVESVTLAGKPSTFRQAMLATINLSAAKTWRFHPASKGGQPVKYRRTLWVENR